MIAEVGRGASSTVFLARSELTGRQVAVKIMPIRTSATEIVRRRFLAEIDRAAQARHPNIVALIERGTMGHAFYFVTDYCDGGNIAHWMESCGGKLKSAEIRPVMQQCLDALKHAHLHRVVHGQYNSARIFCSSVSAESRVARISDFALTIEFGRKFSGLPTDGLIPMRPALYPQNGLRASTA